MSRRIWRPTCGRPSVLRGLLTPAYLRGFAGDGNTVRVARRVDERINVATPMAEMQSTSHRTPAGGGKDASAGVCSPRWDSPIVAAVKRGPTERASDRGGSAIRSGRYSQCDWPKSKLAFHRAEPTRIHGRQEPNTGRTLLW